MFTEIEATKQARAHHRAMFRTMAASTENWHLCKNRVGDGVIILAHSQCDGFHIIVECVNCKSEDTVVNALSLYCKGWDNRVRFTSALMRKNHNKPVFLASSEGN